MSKSNRRSGFTLIELLVVIAIIGLLVALLLPAVQAARESARRTQCENNLKQMGLALMSYHDLNRKFPLGNVYGTYWSYAAALLPELEQQNLYQQIDFKYPTCFAYNQAQGGKGVPSVNLPAVQCPSEPRIGQIYTDPTSGQFALTNYFGVMGTTVWTNDGMLYSNSAVSVAGVTDGTSQTLFVGERGMAGDLLYGWWACGAGIINLGAYDQLLPTDLGLTAGKDDSSHIGHFWSYHPGGADFLFVDGSVRFLPYSINNLVFQQLGTRQGGEKAGDY